MAASFGKIIVGVFVEIKRSDGKFLTVTGHFPTPINFSLAASYLSYLAKASY